MRFIFKTYDVILKMDHATDVTFFNPRCWCISESVCACLKFHVIKYWEIKWYTIRYLLANFVYRRYNFDCVGRSYGDFLWSIWRFAFKIWLIVCKNFIKRAFILNFYNIDKTVDIELEFHTAWKVSVFGVFVVHIFRIFLLSVFGPNAGKYGPEKLQIRTIFTQCHAADLVSEKAHFFQQLKRLF